MQIINLGSRVVNTYLLQLSDGWLMIDTGYEQDFPRFCRKLRKHQIHPREIRYIFLTHAHDDHAGFLNDMLRITNASVILHPDAIQGLQRGQNSFEGGCSGLLACLFCRLLGLLGKGEHRFPALRAEYSSRLIPIETDAFYALHLPFTVIKTPGHTADHISLLAGKQLFCGDAAMNNFPSVHRIIIWIEDPEQYRRSWKKMIRLHPEKIYPAHGKPFPVSDLIRFLPALNRIRLYPLDKSQRM